MLNIINISSWKTPFRGDLNNSIVYGALLGNYIRNGWFGFEAEVFNNTSHVKNLDDIPGFHLRVTTLALNIVPRYSGRSVQLAAALVSSCSWQGCLSVLRGLIMDISMVVFRNATGRTTALITPTTPVYR